MQSHVQQAHTRERERERGEGAIKNFMDIAIKWEHKGVAEGQAGRGWPGWSRVRSQCCLARVHEKQNVLIDETRNTTRRINYLLYLFRNIYMKFRNCNSYSGFWSHVSHGKPKIVLQLPIDCPLDSSGPPTWTWHWILKRTKLVQWSVKRGQRGVWGKVGLEDMCVHKSWMNAPCGWPQAQRFTCIKVNKQKSIAWRWKLQPARQAGSTIDVEWGKDISLSGLKPGTSIVCQPQTNQTELTLLT